MASKIKESLGLHDKVDGEVQVQSGLKYVYRAFVVTAWVIGVVLAQGFWQTFFAIVFFPYAWYLTAEKFLHYFGVI